MRRRLPLFVLPVVLLPGSRLPLHVFEPRYLQMVARCLETDRRFGVIYHDAERGGPFVLAEGAIGCVANILRFQPLPDGRSLLLARGMHRIRVLDGIESGSPYPEALVEPFMDEEDGEASAERRRASVDLLLAVLGRRGTADPRGLDLDEDISFTLAATFEIDAGWQQALLGLRSERLRLDRIDAVFRSLLA